MQKRLWQLHSWFGLAAGLGLLVIGLTGSLLIFHEELEKMVNRELVHVEPTAAGRLPLDTLLRHAERQLPGYEVTGWLPQWDEPDLADVVYVIQHGTNEWKLVTLDPYNGQLLASPRLGKETLTGWLLDLHYTFFADHAGMLIAGAFGLLLCALGVTGVWLYRDFWKNFLRLRWGASLRILLSDTHKFVGISSVAFNLLLGFTGAYWNFTHVIGEWVMGEMPEPVIEKRLYGEALSLDAITRDANERLPGFRANFLTLPFAPEGGITLWGAVEPRGALRSPYGSTVAYGEQIGDFKVATDIRAAGFWKQAVDAFTPLHYGTFGGLPVKMLWFIGGLTPGILAVTGFCIWWMRRRRRSSVAATAERQADLVAEEIA